MKQPRRLARFETLEPRRLLATLNVDSFVDGVDANPGDGIVADAAGNRTLRAAVMEANALPGADVIRVKADNLGEQVLLSVAGTGEDAAATGDLDVTGNLTIMGIGGPWVQINAFTTGDRLFHVLPGASLTLMNVKLVSGQGSPGGAIYNAGTVVLSDSTLNSNQSASQGGGIYNAATGNLTVNRSTLDRNISQTSGGAIYNDGGLVTITNSTISGGGVVTSGGGIFNTAGGTVTITSSTIAYNSANAFDVPGLFGGGIFNSSGTVRLTNTIVAGNNSTFRGTPDDIIGAVDTAGSTFNLVGAASSAGGLVHGVNNNQVGVDPQLGTVIGDHGGPTRGFMPSAGSPAVDAGTNAAAAASDQRGYGRIIDGDGNGSAVIDVGAIERGAAVLNSPPTFSPIAPAGAAVGVPIAVDVDAADTDGHALAFSLLSAPAGASIHPATGVFSWTPSAGDEGLHTLRVAVIDNGLPPMSSLATFQIDVAAANQPPVLATVGGQIVLAGDRLTFDANATDPDGHALVFSLDAGSPAGASIDAASGVFTWDPTTAQLGTHAVTVRVTDNGLPPLADSETIQIRVVEPPRATDLFGTFRNGAWHLDANANRGQDRGDLARAFGIPGDLAVVGDWNDDGVDEIGVYRGGTWFLDANGSGKWDAGDTSFRFGNAGDVPVVADFNRDGLDEVGVFRDGQWFVDFNRTRRWDAGDALFQFGTAGDQPVVGNFGGGAMELLGVFRQGTWYLDANGSRRWDAGDTSFRFGNPGDVAVVADWDHDGAANVGVQRASRVFADFNGSRSWNAGDTSFFFGSAIDQPVTGNWHAAAADKIGVYRSGTWYLDANGSGGWNAGDVSLAFGTAGDQPLASDWNGDGGEDSAVFRQGTWFLDLNANRAWDGGDTSFPFGNPGDQAVLGDWNHDGQDEVGVFRGGQWFVDANGSRRWDAGDESYVFGNPGDVGVVADFNQDGRDEIAVYRDGRWFVDANGTRRWDAGDFSFVFGAAGDQPITGDWTDDGIEKAGVYRGGQVYLDANGSRSWNAGDVTYRFGTAGDVAVAGNWLLPAAISDPFTFNYTGPLPAETIVTYTHPDGSPAQSFAYPGQIQVFAVPGTAVATVTGLIQSNGGAVIAQDPLLGYYLASIAPGTEQVFTASLNGHAAVRMAVPGAALAPTAGVVDLTGLTTLPVVPNLSNQVGGGVYLDMIDYFVDAPGIDDTMNCGTFNITHGSGVNHVAAQGLFGTGQSLNTGDASTGAVSAHMLQSAFHVATQQLAFDPAGRAVINMSLGASETDAAGKPLPAAVYQADVEQFYREQALRLDALARTQPDVFRRTVLVLSAGNGLPDAGGGTTGMDMTAAISRLHADFPNVFPPGGGPHLIIVGASGAGGAGIDRTFEHTNVAGQMVYAPATGVTVHPGGCTSTGTSFAAPAVANLISRVLAANSSLSAAEATRAFMNAYRANGYVLPTVAQIAGQVGVTIVQPTIGVSPPTINVTLERGESTTVPFTVSNSGAAGSTLIYTITDNAPWLALFAPSGGSLAAGASRGHSAAIGTGGLANGNYAGTIFVSDPAAAGGNVAPIGVNLTVIDPIVPNLRISDVQVTEGDSGTVSAVFNVTLDQTVPRDVTFNFSTANGTAAAGSDYAAIGTTSRTIPAGASSTTISVSVIGDTVDENNETFFVNLSSAVNATIADGQGQGTIIDDDVPAAGPGQVVVEIIGNGFVTDTLGRIDTRTGDNVGDYGPNDFPILVGEPPPVLEWRGINGCFSDICPLVPNDFAGGLNLTVVFGSLEVETPAGADVAAGLTDEQRLDEREADALLAAATARWYATGLTHQEAARLAGVRIAVIDLPADQLGAAGPDVIYLDRDAAGYGWFVDSTPGLDEEFRPARRRQQRSVSGSAADGHIDALTAVMHELGHVLGRDHEDGFTLMSDTLGPSVRRLPPPAAVDFLFSRPTARGTAHP